MQHRIKLTQTEKWSVWWPKFCNIIPQSSSTQHFTIPNYHWHFITWWSQFRLCIVFMTIPVSIKCKLYSSVYMSTEKISPQKSEVVLRSLLNNILIVFSPFHCFKLSHSEFLSKNKWNFQGLKFKPVICKHCSYLYAFAVYICFKCKSSLFYA